MLLSYNFFLSLWLGRAYIQINVVIQQVFNLEFMRQGKNLIWFPRLNMLLLGSLCKLSTSVNRICVINFLPLQRNIGATSTNSTSLITSSSFTGLTKSDSSKSLTINSLSGYGDEFLTVNDHAEENIVKVQDHEICADWNETCGSYEGIKAWISSMQIPWHVKGGYWHWRWILKALWMYSFANMCLFQVNYCLKRE